MSDDIEYHPGDAPAEPGRRRRAYDWGDPAQLSPWYAGEWPPAPGGQASGGGAQASPPWQATAPPYQPPVSPPPSPYQAPPWQAPDPVASTGPGPGRPLNQPQPSRAARHQSHRIAGRADERAVTGRVEATRADRRGRALAPGHYHEGEHGSGGRTGGHRRLPMTFVAMAAVGVLAFVIVGIGLGGAYFGRGTSPQAASAAQLTAPCERSEEDAKDFATGTTEAPDPDDAKPPVGRAVAGLGSTDQVPDSGELEDVALWVHPTDPALSTVIGADKGCNRLFVYDLSGRTIQALSLGPVRGDDIEGVGNIDVRHASIGGRTMDLAVVTDQVHSSLGVFAIDQRTRQLRSVAARAIRTAPFPYGVCMYASAATGKLYAFVTQEEEDDHGARGGLMEQWELFDRGGGRIDARKVRTLDTGGEAEGCVADDELGQVYVGNHEAGVFRFGAEADDATTPRQLDTTGPGGHLVADVEGLALVRTGAGGGFVIASSQGNDSFAVYDRRTGRFMENFNVRGGDGALVKEIDGVDASSRNLGMSFPQGVFVVQADGRTFKLIPLQNIAPEG